MRKQSPETCEPHPLSRMSDTTAYSAHIQEAMRYDKLGSLDYSMVLTILHAVAQGWTEEQWKQEQHMLSQQPADKTGSYADASNRYEQARAYFKDLALWPW
jgi:hypothetical protein